MSQKIHPAIVELRKFLHQKGDMNLVAFMQRWMASWLEVAEFESTATTDRFAFQSLGVAVGPECIEKEDVTEGEKTTSKYSILVLRAKKKLVLEGS